MTNRGLPLVCLVALLMVGCVSMAGPGMAGDTEMTDCYKGHRPPSLISVVVYQDASGDVQVLPEVIVVEHPNQTIVWTVVGGEIDDIVFQKSDCAPGPPSIPGRAARKQARIPVGHRGAHKYGFTFYPSKGEKKTVDPMVIVEY